MPVTAAVTDQAESTAKTVRARVVQDHQGWQDGPAGERLRLLVDDAGSAAVLVAGRGETGFTLAPVHGALSPRVSYLDPAALPATTARAVAARERLCRRGVVARVATASLWEAIGTAVIRQVIRAPQARILLHAMREQQGNAVDTAFGPLHSFPGAEQVLSMSDESFSRLGLAFKAPHLRAAATAYLACADSWRDCSPAQLRERLLEVPYIGDWTAGVVVSDYHNDFSAYPTGDLAVRHWARQLVPEEPWPREEKAFRLYWERFTHPMPAEWTVTLLAWGAEEDVDA